VSAFTNFWTQPILANRSSHVCLFLFILAICAVRAYIGLVKVDYGTNDAFVILDSAWRMIHGERPHADFYSPMGLGAFLPTVAGLWLSGGGVQGFGYGQALAGGIFGFWAYLLGRRRLSDVPLVLFCVVVTLTATAATAIGLRPAILTPAVTYNRYGFALIEIVILEALIPARDRRPMALWMGGFSTGGALVLLLFTKASFFFVGTLMISVFALRLLREPKRWQGMLAGFAGMAMLFFAYLGFNPLPMLQDLRIAAGAKTVDFAWYCYDDIAMGAAACAVLCASAALLIPTYARSARRTLWIAGPVIAACGTMLVFTNFEQAGFPLTAITGIVVLESIRDSEAGSPFRTSVLIWCALFVFGPIASDSFGLCSGMIRRASTTRADCLPFTAKNLAGFEGCGEYEKAYVAHVNDGLDLLNARRGSDDSVLTLDFANPFPYALRMTPMRGGVNSQAFNTTFNREHRPSAERMFGSATLVMFPKYFTDAGLIGVEDEIYGPFLKAHYDPAGESEAWRLYRRKAGEPAMFVASTTKGGGAR
jgi:hypothetical protein